LIYALKYLTLESLAKLFARGRFKVQRSRFMVYNKLNTRKLGENLSTRNPEPGFCRTFARASLLWN